MSEDQRYLSPLSALKAVNLMQNAELPVSHLCRVDIDLDNGAPMSLGQTPWRNRSFARISGGVFEGKLIRGNILAGGSDWAEVGKDESGTIVNLDVHSVWETHDSALLHVAYKGRFCVFPKLPNGTSAPADAKGLQRPHHYFRIQPTFETSDPRYTWLNHVVALGVGARTAVGVTYDMFVVL